MLKAKKEQKRLGNMFWIWKSRYILVLHNPQALPGQIRCNAKSRPCALPYVEQQKEGIYYYA